MCKILLFAGTAEGRKIAEYLKTQGTSARVFVATEYGESLITPGPELQVEAGRLTEEEMEQELKSDKIVAIGEIGLDYHYDKENKELQKKLFIKQLEIAKKYNIPIYVKSIYDEKSRGTYIH